MTQNHEQKTEDPWTSRRQSPHCDEELRDTILKLCCSMEPMVVAETLANVIDDHCGEHLAAIARAAMLLNFALDTEIERWQKFVGDNPIVTKF